MVLLHSLLSMSKKWEIKIHIAHLDHGIRSSSIRDAEFVRSTAKRLGIPFTIERIEVKKKKGESLEEAARRIRYDFLRKVKRESGSDLIATAHHKNDLAETVLYRMIRGTGIRGLAGIKPRENDIIRPLLAFSKDEIEEYAKKNSLEYVVDETNFDIKYARNFIRHEVIPVLRRLNPSLVDSLSRLSENSRMVSDFLEDIIEDKIKVEVRKLHYGYDFSFQEHPLLNAELIRRLTELRTGRIPSWLDIDRCLDIVEKGRGKITFWGNFGAWVSLGKIFVGNLERENIEFALSEGEYDFLDFKVTVRNGYGLKNSSGMILRNRRKGDRIGKKKLKDYLAERRIPAYLRDEVPLIAVGDEIVWISGEIVNKRFRGEGFDVRILQEGI